MARAREDERDLVHFVCWRVEHRRAGGGDGTLLTHDGLTAFCPAAAPDAEHEWTRIEPLPLRVLRQSARG